MKFYPLRLGLALGAAVSLFAMYLVFLDRFYPILGNPMDIVESVILYTMAIRAGALFLVPKFRKIYSPLKIIVYSVEILVVVSLIFAFSLTGEKSYLAIATLIFPAWIASSFFILLPYFILEFGIALYHGERLYFALASAVLLLADSTFAANFALSTLSIPSNLSVLGSNSIGSVIKQPGLISIGSFSSLVVTGAGVVFYLSMLSFVSASQVELTKYQGKYTFALLIMLIGSAVLLGWTFLFLDNQITNMFWILSVPGILLPFFLLVGFHGRQEKVS